MAIRLTCVEKTDKTAERDWVGEQLVDEVEYNAICAELGGEPTGDVVLLEETQEGSESTAPREWRVRTAGAGGSLARS